MAVMTYTFELGLGSAPQEGTANRAPVPATSVTRISRPQASLLHIACLATRITTVLELRLAAVEILAGQILQIIGPNGAGKSCLVEALIGLRKCEQLEGTILGAAPKDIHRFAGLRRRLGVQVQHSPFGHDARTTHLLRLHKALYGSQDGRLYELLSIAELERRRYGELSGGERRRLDLFIALSHHPLLAILDEPTTGLDQRYARDFRQYIAETRPNAATLMVTHVPDDLFIASRILWVADGRAIAYGSPDDLLQQHLGPCRGSIVFYDRQDLECFRRGLTSEARTFVENDCLTLYGPLDIESDFRRATPELRVKSYSFVRTDVSDLLWHASRGRT